MEITSAPYLLDPTHFNLKDPESNKRRLQDFYDKYPNKKIGLHRELPLIEFTVSEKESYIVLVHPTSAILYLVHLKAEKLPQLTSSSVTQVEVWRRLGAPQARGLAKFVVFSILLHRYKYIVSDKSQTERGRDFWIDLLGDAASLGHKVGVTLDDDPVEWKGDTAYEQWMRLVETEAWGTENKHFYTRFVIAA
jgi:hypothetical protein